MSKDWRPPEGWVPDASWPAAPDDWEFWVRSAPAVESTHVARHSAEAQESTIKGPARPNRFSNRLVGIVAGLAGLILGLAFGSGESGTGVDSAAQATKIAEIRENADEDVEQAREEALAEAEAVTDEEVAAALKEERAKRSDLIDEAVAKAVAKTKASNKPKTLVDATDPRFDTCGAANAAGFGNYRRGTDTEYGWYEDRDGDGVVCE